MQQVLRSVFLQYPTLPVPEECCPFCLPLALNLQKVEDRRGLLALQESDFRVSRCYSGMDPKAGLGFGCLDLGHLSATRAGLDWASECGQQQHLFSCAWGERGVLLTLVLIADLSSLPLEHQPCLPGALGITQSPCHLSGQCTNPTDLPEGQILAWTSTSLATGALGRGLATPRCGERQLSRSLFRDQTWCLPQSCGS